MFSFCVFRFLRYPDVWNGASAAFVGIAWGFFVLFVLDRLVLTFHRKGSREYVRAIPRLLLAASLAVLIGEPFLVRMFQNEIELQLQRDSQTVQSEARLAAEARVKSEREGLQNATREMQQRLDQLKGALDEKEGAVVGEIEGAVGSGVPGDGPAAARKQQAFTDAKAANQQAVNELGPRINANNERLGSLQAAIDAEVQAVAQAHRAAGMGMMTRHQALFAIMKREPGAAFSYVPLFLILVLTELSPIISKLAFPPSEYDRRLSLKQRNAIAQASRAAALERLLQKRLVDVKNTLSGRVIGIVNGNLVHAVRPEETEVADRLRSSVLDELRNMIEPTRFREASNSDFGPNVSIQISGRPDLRINMQLPQESRSSITLADLDYDLQAIAREVSDETLPKVTLVSSLSSSGRPLQSDVPLLPQLEKDQILNLTFAPNHQEAEAAIA